MLQNISSEKAILMAFIESNNLIEHYIGLVREEYFSVSLHKKIFNFIFDSFIKKMDISDDVILSEFQEEKAEVEEILLSQAANAKTIKYHIKNIQQSYQTRQLLSKMELAKEEIKKGNSIDISKLFEDVEIQEDEVKINKLSDIVSSLEKQMSEKKDDPITVGIREFDDKITLSAGDFIVIGARPSMGKTGFMNTVALNLAKNRNRGCIVFSLEMPSEKIIARMLANVGHIPMNEINHGLISDFNAYVEAKNNLVSMEENLMVLDHVSDIDNIIKSIYYIKSQTPHINDFFIDHLGHIKTTRRFNSEHLKINYITKELKEVAKSTGVRIWLLSQLNRSVEERTNRRPMLSDLRESGSIEEVADIVLGLYRDSYYKVKEGKIEKEPEINDMEIIILKQRDGETSTIKTNFSGKYMQVGNQTRVEELTVNVYEQPYEYETPMQSGPQGVDIQNSPEPFVVEQPAI